ncbi:uncharacterized protein [Choristoneura fumiferana]|uniref:uncharacterized protein n=1 Tax=Choristoneura fumiferana TaxID=7141 RepID=UPI003D15945A
MNEVLVNKMLKFLGSVLLLVAILGVQCERKRFNIDDIKDFSAVIESGPLRFIKRVLICSNEEASEQIMEHRLDIFTLFPNMTIEFLDVRQCPHEIRSDRHGDKSILAVIAPEPFDDIPDSEVPIYFYEAPYFLENLDAYSNNIPALIDWRPLKHAFTHFFEQQGWIRIAIVSDNSPYSAAFEEELVGHFNEKQLVYNVQRCVETLHHDCDFKEALQFIIDNNALIVVANVDARNAWVLLKQAREHGVTRKNEFIWLARDWPFVNVSKKELFDISPIISLTLAPLMKETANPELHSKATRGPHLARILQGLTLVEDAVRHTKRYRIDHFYRDIAKHMNSAIIKDTYDARAFIRKIDVNDKSEVLTIVVANSQLVTSVTTVNNSTPKVYDVIDCKIMRSNVFTDPCNDFWISLIVLVVLLFILLLFLIIHVYVRYFAYFENVSNARKTN